jgi:putative ABC transport system permease protein
MLRDITSSIRALLKNPSFTVTAVPALALAIGANTAIFSVVNAVLLRPLQYQYSSRIVIPALTNPKKKVDRGRVSYMDYLAWQNGNVFEHLAVFREASFDVTGGDEPEHVQVAAVTEDYFSVLGTEPSLGRAFLPEEQLHGSNSVAVLSYGLWQRRFGSDAGIIGQAIGLNGERFLVVGVMPPDSLWPSSVDAVYPMGIGANPPAYAQRNDNFVWRAIARLKPDESVEQTQVHLVTIARRMEEDHPESRTGWGATAIPVHEWIVGREFRLTLMVLFGAGALVLLIACANVANLLLTRATTREREFAIRIALGAGRRRLTRQLMTENLLLGLIGGTVGLPLALLGIKLLVAFAPDNIPSLNRVGLDGYVLGFVIGTSILTPLAFGLLPALRASSVDVNESLRDAGRGTTPGLRGRRIRDFLVVIEIALSVMISIGAGLMIRSYARLQQVELGFRVDNLLTLRITLPRPRYPNSNSVATSYERILDRINTLPGVNSSCASSSLPLGGGGYYGQREFLSEGQVEPPAGPDYAGHWMVITSDYFDAIGTPLLKGRTFTKDDTAESPPVIIVNQSMARQMFSDENPIGHRIRSWRSENKLREIIGIVADVRYLSRDDMQRPLVYVPHRQDTWIAMVLTVRTTTDPTSMIHAIREEIRTIDKNLAIADVETMEQVLGGSVSRPRFTLVLLSTFACIALGLAALGIYSVVSYSVSQRTHEMGIRMALGAQRHDLFRLVIGRAIAISGLGLGIGLVTATAVTRVMSSLLYGLSALDPIIFAGVPVFLTAVALLASYIPARTAVEVDAALALKHE